MRISDWSSDVCSSDLAGVHFQPQRPEHPGHQLCGLELLEAQLGPGVDALAPVGPFRGKALERGMDGWHGGSVVREAVDRKIGSASCRERMGQYVSISVRAGSFKKKIITEPKHR